MWNGLVQQDDDDRKQQSTVYVLDFMLDAIDRRYIRDGITSIKYWMQRTKINGE